MPSPPSKRWRSPAANDKEREIQELVNDHATKLDQLCDFSRHEREVEKYRKFEGDVSPNSTFAVDDNWRMVQVRDLYPQWHRPVTG